MVSAKINLIPFVNNNNNFSIFLLQYESDMETSQKCADYMINMIKESVNRI